VHIQKCTCMCSYSRLFVFAGKQGAPTFASLLWSTDQVSRSSHADAVIEAVLDTYMYFSCNMHQPQDLSTGSCSAVKLRQCFQSQERWEHAFGYQDPSHAT